MKNIKSTVILKSGKTKTAATPDKERFAQLKQQIKDAKLRLQSAKRAVREAKDAIKQAKQALKDAKKASKPAKPDAAKSTPPTAGKSVTKPVVKKTVGKPPLAGKASVAAEKRLSAKSAAPVRKKSTNKAKVAAPKPARPKPKTPVATPTAVVSDQAPTMESTEA